MTFRLFDLNIEEVLENWEVHHAIRELISNALDEQLLSKTQDPEIVKSRDVWHVRDFGRGIRIENFTQNENPEKLSAPAGVIGKFGVGLKDAMATLHRHGIPIEIRSTHGTFRLKTADKPGFNGIRTLHIEYDDTAIQMQGTDIALPKVLDEDVAAARALFLRFSAERPIEETQYGQILDRPKASARVYITGVLAADEPNFLFTYNITSLTSGMRKRLNRERLNVGRSTYTERVVAILKQAASSRVQDALGDEALKSKGDQCDEMQWLEVSQLALNLLSERKNGGVTFVTETQLQAYPSIVDTMRRDGLQVVLVGESQQARLQRQVEAGGPVVRTMNVYLEEYHDSFQYKFVDPSQLSKQERQVFEQTASILALLDRRVDHPVRISETIRPDLNDFDGVWVPSEQLIVIKRTALESLAKYAGVLLHEAAHAATGTADVTRDFESALTDFLGSAGSKALRP